MIPKFIFDTIKCMSWVKFELNISIPAIVIIIVIRQQVFVTFVQSRKLDQLNVNLFGNLSETSLPLCQQLTHGDYF